MQETRTQLIAGIIHDAGGKVVGSTRLHKIAFLLEVAGCGSGFRFHYTRYGPYSDEVAAAAEAGALLGDLSEKQHSTDWGGRYSVYSAEVGHCLNAPVGRQKLAKAAARASTITLDLAATALYLSVEKCPDPWGETRRRKPDLAKGQGLKNAKKLLEKLRSIEVPTRLPTIP